MPRLNSATKTAAQKVADKLSKTPESTTINPTSVNSSHPISGTITTPTEIPGLLNFSPTNLAGMMPNFNPDNYQITDPLNPGQLPYTTQEQYDKAITIYEGAQRSLRLNSAAFDTTKERFTAIGKHAQMVGQGIKTAVETEKVKGTYLTYLGQVEANKQGEIALNLATTKTQNDNQISQHTRVEMSEKLRQAEINAEIAKAKTAEALGKLNEFKKQLGQYALTPTA